MTGAQSTNCVVVGGGLAGMVAARRLQQSGVEVVVLEKGHDEGGIGNTIISGGLLHVAWESPDATYSEKHSRLLADTDDEIDPNLADALAAQSAHIVPWLKAEGISVRRTDFAPVSGWTRRKSTKSSVANRMLPEVAPRQAMIRLYERFRSEGGQMHLGSAAHSLERLASAWRVAYEGPSGHCSITALSVLFTDGGFQANAEMLNRYVGPNAGLCLLRATRSGTGDALRMLLANGAGAVGLGRVYGHIASIDALRMPQLWPVPHLDELSMAGLIVDRQGLRFQCGTTSPVGLVTRMARTDDPRGFTVIFDRELWFGPAGRGRGAIPGPNPELPNRGGHLVTADGVGDLASLLGLNPEWLAEAVGQHNAETSKHLIVRPPFYAARVVPGITFTMGGAIIAANAAVCRPDGRPIEGLFAAGGTAGGVHGGPNGGYVGGLTTAATFGYIAANSIAAGLRAR